MRSLPSDLVTSSGLSFRNCRALSLPCPIRYVLKLNHEPLFSTRFARDAQVQQIAFAGVPRPYRISNSASRNGVATLSFTTLTRVRLTNDSLAILNRESRRCGGYPAALRNKT